MTKNKFLKKLDIFLLILFPLLSVFLSLTFKTNLLVSTILFYGLPATWLSIRNPKSITKTFIFSLILIFPFGAIVDYIATINGSWVVPTTVFSFRLFNIVPIENLIFGFILIYSTIIFYEHFHDKGKNKTTNILKWLLSILISISIVFCLIYLLKPQLFIFKYAYFWLGIFLLLIPCLSFISFFPKLLSKYIKTTIYFFGLSLIFELTALQLGQWTFSGNNFVFWIKIYNFTFPFEELFFYMIMFNIAVLSYYEFFDDDRK